jgi:hypothetical protein
MLQTLAGEIEARCLGEEVSDGEGEEVGIPYTWSSEEERGNEDKTADSNSELGGDERG